VQNKKLEPTSDSREYATDTCGSVQRWEEKEGNAYDLKYAGGKITEHTTKGKNR